jgi:hypothetical protein
LVAPVSICCRHPRCRARQSDQSDGESIVYLDQGAEPFCTNGPSPVGLSGWPIPSALWGANDPIGDSDVAPSCGPRQCGHGDSPTCDRGTW